MDSLFIKETIKILEDNQKLIGVSKTRSKEEIIQAYNEGVKIFGENYVQELIAKYNESDPFSWHFIGRIQTNKIKDIVARVDLIHSVYRKKELEEINKQAEKINKKVNILIEINLVEEDETHGGIRLSELDEFVLLCMSYENINLKGFMVIGPNTDDLDEIERVLRKGEEIFLKYQSKYSNINELSMGMSNDYHLALKHHATLIRIGTKIFGKRSYDV